MLKVKLKLESEAYATLCAIAVIGAFIVFALYITPLPSYWTCGYENGIGRPSDICGNNDAAYDQQSNSGRTPPFTHQQSPPSDEKSASGQTGEKETDKQLAEFTRELVWVGVAQAVILGVSVIALGVQAAFLWGATRESTKQHIVTNRAFVFLRSFGYMPMGRTAGRVEYWRITTVLENTGHTPTKRMISYHSADLRETPLPDDFDFPDTPYPPGTEKTISRDMVGPHAQLSGGLYNLSIDEILDIKDKRKRFYIWGWIDYDDVFPGTKRHRTEYCYELMVLYDPTNPQNNQALGMSLHRTHNGADDECRREPAPYTPA